MNEQTYKKIIDDHKTKLKENNRKSALFGNLRLLLALASTAFVTLLIIYWFSILYLSLLVAVLIGFIFLTALHSEISGRINHSKGIININEEYLKRLSGEWKSFPDTGREYADYNHNYSHDLDIFGEKSLFQFINVTKTPFGRKKLKNDLSAPKYTKEEISDRQTAIAELSANDNLSHDFQYYGKKIKLNKDLPKVISYVKQKQEFLRTKWLKYVLCPLPFVILAACAVLFSVGTTGCRIAAAALMILQLLLWAGFSPKTLNYLSNSEKIHYSLSDYSALYELLESQRFDAKILKNIQSDLAFSNVSAAKATKQLGKVLQKIQVRTSGIMYIILNILFLWDISCALNLSAWAKKYGGHIEQWFDGLGEFESLLSFSVLGGVLDRKCMAAESDKKHTLTAANIGHPLLTNQNRICNSFLIEKNINIVSGSNMSGKTTFLRTLGINLLLAKNGSYVCADKMIFSNMDIVSSMRVSDDLTDGISTFYSELKKIKRILEAAKESDDMFFLIDEIFRGTNSADRTAGAKEVIKKLMGYNAYGLLTTHDLKMCEKTSGIDIANYNFSERYENGQLKFDYKIREGIAKTTNGEYLMKIIGIM